MSLRILLDDIPDVIGLPRLLEFPPGHEVFDLSDGADGVLVGVSQARNILNSLESV